MRWRRWFLAAGLTLVFPMPALGLPLPPTATGDLFIGSFDIDGGVLFARSPGGTLRIVIQPYPEIDALAFQNPSTLLVGSEGLQTVDRIRLKPDGTVQSRSTLLTSTSGEAMALDSHGVLYVSSLAGRIERVTFAPDGSVSTRTLFTASPHASGLAIGPSGSLFVTEASRDDVERLTINPDGTLGGLAVLTAGFGNLGALAFDTAGNLFVGYEGGIDLLGLNPDGSLASRSHISSIVNVTALAFDDTGALYAAVGIPGGNAIHELTLDPSGRVLTDQNILSMDPFGPNALAFQPVEAASVPEPATWTLLLAGFSALLVLGRWKFRARERR